MFKTRIKYFDFNKKRLEDEMANINCCIQYASNTDGEDGYIDIYRFKPNDTENDGVEFEAFLADVQSVVDAHDILAQIREHKFKELDAARDAEIYGSFEFEGKTYACDKAAREDIVDVERAYRYAKETGTEFTGRYWYTLHGQEVVFIPSAKIPDFCIQASYVKDEAWSKFATLANQLKAATTKEGIEVITW